jgi:hypothetical protein
MLRLGSVPTLSGMNPLTTAKKGGEAPNPASPPSMSIDAYRSLPLEA